MERGGTHAGLARRSWLVLVATALEDRAGSLPAAAVSAICGRTSAKETNIEKRSHLTGRGNKEEREESLP